MFRERWGRPAFWRWWWRHHVSPEVRFMALIGAVGLLLAGGWLSAARLSSATAGEAPTAGDVVRTVVRFRTVRERVVATAPRRVETRTVRVAHVVTTAGPTQTVYVTNERTVTALHTETAVRTRTVEHVQRVTVTDTPPAQTVVLTEMQPPSTVTTVVTVTVRRH